MRLFTLLLTAVALAIPARASEYELPVVCGAYVATPFAILLHTDNSTTICELSDLAVHDWSSPNEFGYPTFFLAGIDADTNPSILESEWTGDDGLLHRVRTPCGARTADACASWHRIQVRAMLRVFPIAPRVGYVLTPRPFLVAA